MDTMDTKYPFSAVLPTNPNGIRFLPNMFASSL